nr:enoyl-CoA hydratase-related protein [Ruminiclostridium josui]
MNFETIDVRFQDTFCFLKFNRLEAKNAITNRLVDEVLQVAEMCEESVTVLILEGSPEYFCFGADFEVIYETMKQGEQFEQDPEPLYNLWLKLATGHILQYLMSEEKPMPEEWVLLLQAILLLQIQMLSSVCLNYCLDFFRHVYCLS